MKPWIVGWDPSRNGYHALVLIDENQAIVRVDKRKGLNSSLALLASFEALAKKANRKLILAIEYSHPELTEQIHRAGFHEIYVLDARKVKGYKDNCIAEDKTDEIDAYACASYLYHNLNKLRRYRPATSLEKRACDLTAQLDSLVAQKTQAWQRFWAIVDRGSPEIKSVLENKEVRWFLDLFTDLLPKMKHTSYAAFVQFCRKRGARSGSDVLMPLHHYLRVLAEIIDPRLPMIYTKQINVLLEIINLLEKEASTVLDDWEDAWILLSVKGIGAATAIRLLAHLGEDWSHWTVTQISKLAGLAPLLRGSGIPTEQEFLRLPRHKRKRMRIKRFHRIHCNKRLKNTLCQFTLFSLGHNPWAYAAYQAMRGRGQDHWEAIRNLAMKWVKILLTLMQNKDAYNPLYHQQQIAKRSDPMVRAA